MAEETQYRSRRDIHNASHKGRKRGKKRKGGCLKFFILTMLVIIVAVGAYLFTLYNGIEKLSNKIYTSRPENQQVLREEAVDLKNQIKPFSVLVLGIDTGEEGRTEVGRSDVMMVVTVNAQKNQTTIVSIPRDTKTEIVGRGTEDKINHAYAFGGVAMSVNSVQKLLNVPIDYTVTVDMGDFERLVDALGGVNITPITTFSEGGFSFVEGQPTHMTGPMALAYVRNRNDSGGDYGRQERQRQLISSMLKSAASPDTLASYQNLFNSLENIVKTDVTFDEMKSIVTNYNVAAKKVNQLQLSGTGAMIDGVYYDVPNPDSLAQVQQLLKGELDIR